MKIVVTTGGTLGDIVPFCAIAKVLAGRGHEVVVATSPDYRVLVESLGLRFAKVGDSFRALIETPLGRSWNSTESARVYMKLTRELLVPLMDQTTADMRGAVMDADLVLFHPFNLGAYHTAEARGIKAVLLAMVPWPVSGEIEPLWVPGTPRIAWLRRALARAAADSFCGLFREGHDTHRASIGLPRFREKNYFDEIFARGVPFLHLFSPSLVPRPSDWPTGAEVMGFCDLIEQDADFVPSTELTRFLDEGEPPLYVGFGSTTGDKPEALNPIVFGAIKRLGRRAIVAGGWCGLGNDGTPVPSEGRRASKNVFQIPYVPHTWLFPRVSAVVHHGSTGSLSAGLKAGRPTLRDSILRGPGVLGHPSLRERCRSAPGAASRPHRRSPRGRDGQRHRRPSLPRSGRDSRGEARRRGRCRQHRGLRREVRWRTTRSRLNHWCLTLYGKSPALTAQARRGDGGDRRGRPGRVWSTHLHDFRRCVRHDCPCSSLVRSCAIEDQENVRASPGVRSFVRLAPRRVWHGEPKKPVQFRLRGCLWGRRAMRGDTRVATESAMGHRDRQREMSTGLKLAASATAAGAFTTAPW